jgi:hypothetical protein
MVIMEKQVNVLGCVALIMDVALRNLGYPAVVAERTDEISVFERSGEACM